MSELDADGNGSIDFEEFFAWINKPRDENDSSGFEGAILKAKLAARYYRKVARSGYKKLKGRIGDLPAQPGDTSINIDLNAGSPEDMLSVELKQKEGNGTVSAAAFITLRDGATEESINLVVETIKNALQMAPFQEMPGYVSHSVEAVDYREGRAIRFQVINAINFLQMAEGKVGFNPTDIKINQAKVTVGANLESLLDGNKTLRDLLKGRFQFNMVIPNKAKAVLRELYLMNTFGPGPNRMDRVFGPIAGMAAMSSLQDFTFAMEFDDVVGSVLEMAGAKGGDAAEISSFFTKVLDVELSGLRTLLNAGVKTGYEMVLPMSEQLPPFAGTAINNYDAFTCLMGFGGLEVNFGDQAYAIELTGVNPFALLPLSADRDAAPALPSSPSEAPQVLEGPLLELMYEPGNPAQIPRPEE